MMKIDLDNISYDGESPTCDYTVPDDVERFMHDYRRSPVVKKMVEYAFRVSQLEKNRYSVLGFGVSHAGETLSVKEDRVRGLADTR